MRKIYSADAPQGEIVCHSPDGSIYRFVEPDYWQLVTPAPIPAPGSEAAFGEFKQAGQCSIKTGGVTVRDYFAAKAMAGLLGDTAQRNGTTSALAETAYMIADAMIQERSK